MITLPVQMSKAKESSNPFFLELYEISLRTETLHIVAADEDIVFNGQTFTAIPFKRGDITKTMDSIDNEVNIELSDCSDDLLAYVIHGFDFRGCKVSIIRVLYPDCLTSNTFAWVFGGEIDEPQFQNGVFSCKVQSRFPLIEAPTRDYKLACNSSFGDEECGMSLETVSLFVQSVDGNRITIPDSYETGYWKNGTITVGGESRIIISSDDNILDLNVNFIQDLIGKEVTLMRGCDKTAECCKKYNNMIHFSGFPAIPFESVYR